jgi:F0F1-type ATP synthase assembly protein I
MPSIWTKSGIYLDLVYTFPGAILAGTGLGWLADRWLVGTKPYLTMVGFLLGLAAAFWYLFKMLAHIQKGEGGKGAG